MPHFSYSIIDYFQVEAIQFRGQGQRIWPNGSPWASVSEIVGQPDGLDEPSRRRFCRLEFSPSATLKARWAKVSPSPPAKTPADRLIQMVIQKWVLSEEEGRALSTMIPPTCNVCQAASRKD